VAIVPQNVNSPADSRSPALVFHSHLFWHPTIMQCHYNAGALACLWRIFALEYNKFAILLDKIT
jgi:hypothetical protein